MKMKKSKLTSHQRWHIILIFAIIAIAGCTGFGRSVNADANNGISIVLFAASPAEERSGGLILFDLEIENVGGTTARNVRADLFGVERQWRNTDGSLITDTKPEFGTATLKPPNLQRQVPGD